MLLTFVATLLLLAHGYECDGESHECSTEATADTLRRELTQLQTRDCSSATSRRLLYTFWNGGLGAEVHAMSLALTLAHMSNRTLVTQRGGHWVYVAEGSGSAAFGDETAYLEPVSGRDCLVPTVDAWNSTPWWRGGSFDADSGALRWSDDGNDAEPALLFTSQINPDPWLLRHALPARFAAKGLLWWRSQLVRFLFRPKAELEASIAADWARLDIGVAAAFAPLGDCVAVHVRRGDKAREDATRVDVSEYLVAAREFGLRHIVLASDDPDVLSRDDLGADVHVLRHATFGTGGFDQGRLMHAYYNRTAAATSTIRDVSLLARCAASVGTMSSNLSRLIHELQTAALGRAALFKSLSSSWKSWYVFP
jgi:hypothetical protein